MKTEKEIEEVSVTSGRTGVKEEKKDQWGIFATRRCIRRKILKGDFGEDGLTEGGGEDSRNINRREIASALSPSNTNKGAILQKNVNGEGRKIVIARRH